MMEKNAAWRARDEARKANPIAITKVELAALRKVFHPDPEHDTATAARKAQLNAVAAIFNEIAPNSACSAGTDFSPARKSVPYSESPNIGYNRTAIRRKDELGEEPCARSVLFCSVSQ
jgi:hypothetical protein